MNDTKRLGRTFRLRAKTVTPLHIGTGNILLRAYDYRTQSTATFVLNQDVVLAREYERTNTVPTKPAGQYVTEQDLVKESRFVRYSLSGTTTLDQIHEQIKDVEGNLYLPGSSLKGVLRTVLLARAGANGDLGGETFDDRSPKTAAQPFERKIFRPKADNANYDLLRAIQLADSKPVRTAPNTLVLQHVRVIADDSASIPIAVEVVPRNVTFECTLRLDDYLLRDKAAELGWGGTSDLLEHLPEFANEWADRQIQRDRQLAEQMGWEAAGKVYSAMLQRQRTPQVFLVQMGWGTGWESTTVGTYLPDDQVRAARERFELGKPPQWKGHWRPNFDKPFPKGHRLTVKENKNSAPAQEPLGWVLVEMKAA